MERCENMIGAYRCTNDAYASVFGVAMCSSCISRELHSIVAEKYISKVRIDAPTAIRSLIEKGARFFSGSAPIVPSIPKDALCGCPEFHRKGVSRSKSNKVSVYEIKLDGLGDVGRIVRDEDRDVWFVILKGDKNAVDVAGNVADAVRLMWYHHRKGGL